ncbi:MAG: hypothetical protein EOM54_03205 [Clostridia bacterium]|nr:hypothetical protein [Clostridia bacterium]
MSDCAWHETLDIFARRVLAKAELLRKQVLFQEDYSDSTPLGTISPLRLYIINSGAEESEQDPNIDYGSPVQCVKLCKRIFDGDPRNTIICSQKSKVVIDYELVLIVEFEDSTFDVLTLPKNLSSRLHYDASVTKAFVDGTVIDAGGVPVTQHQNTVQPYELLVIKSTGTNIYSAFEYSVSIPLSSFSAVLRKCELEDPTLQSYIVLRNLDCEVEVLDRFLVYTAADRSRSIWTTIVEFSLFEDIIDKLGIDQDIQICGTPEYVCQDHPPCIC